MNCSICGASGTRFMKAIHRDRGLVYLCEDCYKKEREALHPAGSSCTCHPPQH
ncbi:hypothetical protein [Methanosphaerula subterraneus]|jgi:ribosome-binding protein aMBF1 (putative translation factor)|uniref:hypothetical protein n=1 Tax=Methanosphaerula subterraneus TaxID=3350244 RepID=UPI003F85E506